MPSSSSKSPTYDYADISPRGMSASKNKLSNNELKKLFMYSHPTIFDNDRDLAKEAAQPNKSSQIKKAKALLKKCKEPNVYFFFELKAHNELSSESATARTPGGRMDKSKEATRATKFLLGLKQDSNVSSYNTITSTIFAYRTYKVGKTTSVLKKRIGDHQDFYVFINELLDDERIHLMCRKNNTNNSLITKLESYYNRSVENGLCNLGSQGYYIVSYMVDSNNIKRNPLISGERKSGYQNTPNSSQRATSVTPRSLYIAERGARSPSYAKSVKVPKFKAMREGVARRSDTPISVRISVTPRNAPKTVRNPGISSESEPSAGRARQSKKKKNTKSAVKSRRNNKAKKAARK
jgi:hypothetical protein